MPAARVVTGRGSTSANPRFESNDVSEHQVSATPTFIIGSQKLPGAIPYDRFEAAVREAAPR